MAEYWDGKKWAGRPIPYREKEKQMYQEHPNLSPEINAALRDMDLMELNGGIHYDKLPAGSRIEVQTKNTRYEIEKRSEEQTFIVGHAKYCPVPAEVKIHGSTRGGSMIRIGWIGVGMHLEFGMAGKPVTTSEIQSVRLLD